MKIYVSPNAEYLGMEAAGMTAGLLREAIEKDGKARLLLSTGMSQFTTLSALINIPDICWSKVEMFHLDEYIGLPMMHRASFRRYLQERFIGPTGIQMVHYVDVTPDGIDRLNAELKKAPIHVGLIGIGQNAHVAFNDPPADFETEEPYIIVRLTDDCKRQQISEGWFDSVDDVPSQAVTMSVKQIMKCQTIISAVPYREKAEAVSKVLSSSLTPEIPATVLKTHPDFHLFLDRDSFALTDAHNIVPAEGDTSVEMNLLY